MLVVITQKFEIAGFLRAGHIELLASERSERDTIRGNKWKSEICIYIYIWYVQDTLVARVWCYIMWEELSVSHF